MAGHRDPARYLTGTAAVILCSHFMWQHMNVFSIFIASVFLCSISITDTLCSRIPNLAVLVLVLLGIIYHVHHSGLQGLTFAATGLLAGLALLILPYSMGGTGAGDVKALAALGSLLGPANIFQVFLYTALIGGFLALLHSLMSRSLRETALSLKFKMHVLFSGSNLNLLRPAGTGENPRFPYAAAITFGYFAQLHWGSII